MTKYEWESELKKNLHRLPADEIQRIFEYYDELFADKIERGYNECEIVSQFGNPVDVADKILSDYDGETTREAEPVPPPALSRREIKRGKAETADDAASDRAPEPARIIPEPQTYGMERKEDGKRKKAGRRQGALNWGRVAVFLTVNFFTGFAFFIILLSIWIVLFAVVAAGAACAVGGVAGTVISLFPVFRGFMGAGAAQIGMCVALCGAGIIMTAACVKFIKLFGIANGKLFGAIGRWMTGKTEVYYEQDA